MSNTVESPEVTSNQNGEQNNTKSGATTDEFQKTVHQNSKLIASLTHISGIFMGPILPLLIYLFVQDKLVKETAKEVVNFEITLWALLGILGFITPVFIALIITIPLALITGLGFLVVAAGQLIFPIIGALRANDGKSYRYPFTYRLIK